jgi:MFS family permease
LSRSSPPAPPPGRLPRTVLWFGVVSLLTDAAGELIYPLLPLFLITVVGAKLSFIGVIEGIAEATASLFKLVSGRISDRIRHRKRLVLFGYGLASAARPLVALAHSAGVVLAVRFVDRLGKGVRSSPRDAMVAEATPPSLRGAAYGYHRAMDNAGAVLGPLCGFALLRFGHLPLRSIFALAAIPGALAVLALVFGVVEVPRPAPAPAPPFAALHNAEAAWQRRAGLPRPLLAYLACVALFTLGNSADAFLLVRAAQVLHPGRPLGPALLADAEVLLLWTAHNAVKAALSTHGGRLSDRLGRRRLIAAGWLLYAAVYLGFALVDGRAGLWALFGLYGVYYALCEGPERALVAELAGEGQRGTAFGWFHGVVGLCALPASLGFGLIYSAAGALPAFATSAALATLATLLLFLVRPRASRAAPVDQAGASRS